MAEPTIFFATPSHNGWLHTQYVAGMLQAAARFSGRYRADVHLGSFLPRNRDLLVTKFLRSEASHMMCIDSDIGWTADQVETLLATGLDFVSGVYAKKQADRQIPAKLIRVDGRVCGAGPVLEAEYVPAGFLLLTRRCVEQMADHYRESLSYKTSFGDTVALWSSIYQRGDTYAGEDVAFCRRWTAIGGRILLHTDVVVRHFGEQCFTPEPENLTFIH